MIKFLVKKMGGVFTLKNKINNADNFYKKVLRKLIYTPLFEEYLEQMGSFIGIDTKFEDTPILPHNLLGIFISNKAHIGKNVVIFQQVTIGSSNLPDSKNQGAPNIGNNCYVGAGAKIIGNVTIGDNVRIGANCVVVKDVPSNTVVVNQPLRMIQKEKLNNEFIKI